MTIFIGYGYNDQDKWVEEWVFPLVESYGFKVESGKELFKPTDKSIPESVISRIKKSDGVIVFLTRRSVENSSTHRWCIEERAITIPHNIPSMEFREESIDDEQYGVFFDRQHIKFNINNWKKLVIDIANVIGTWQNEMRTQIVVLCYPNDIKYKDYSSKIDTLKCIYCFITDGVKTDTYESNPYKSPDGSIVVNIKQIPTPTSTTVKIMLINQRNQRVLLEENLAIHYHPLKANR